MDKTHEMFTPSGISVRVCCECRRLRRGDKEYARFSAATSAETCAQCGRDFCPKCNPPEAAPAADEYEKLGAEIGRLVRQKQAAYGDAHSRAGAVMRILYPNGISLEQMDDALTVVRVVDKLFRIATDRDALGESPWRDIAGYGLLGAARAERPAPRAIGSLDIYTRIAAEVFNVAPERVTAEQLRVGKEAAYAAAYDVEPHVLASRLDLFFEEARASIECASRVLAAEEERKMAERGANT